MPMVTDDSVPFVGRVLHCSTFLDAVVRVRGTSAKMHVHFSGPPQIGKHTLCEELNRRAKASKDAICLDLDLSDPNGYDPFLYLLKLRELARSKIPNINTDAFDYVAMLFGMEHRQGNYVDKFLGDSIFEPKLLLAESFADVIKKGAESATSDLWKALAPAAFAGTVTFATIFEQLPSVVQAGGSAVGVALGTGTLAIVYKVARHKFRQRRLGWKHKSIASLMARQAPPRAGELLAMLPALLGSAIDEAVSGEPETLCIFLEPTEMLATSNLAAQRTGSALFEVAAGVRRSITTTTSETSFDKWVSSTQCSSLLSQHLHPILMTLEKLQKDEVSAALVAAEMDVEAALARLVDDDGAVFPARFKDWWMSQVTTVRTGRQGVGA